MSTPIRFQVLVLPNVAWEVQLERARQVERLGFDVLATADHLVDWTAPDKPIMEAWSLLAGFAASTSTIRLTTAVSQIPLRHPAVLAHAAVTVDLMSRGRLEVGIGTGLRVDPGTEMAGLDNWSNAERVARIGEYAQVLRLLMTQEVSTFAGQYYSLNAMVTSPMPIQQPPPIMIAAMGPKMLRQAALYADIWNSLSFSPSFDDQLTETRDRVMSMRETCDEVGRDFATLRSSFTFYDPASRHRGGLLSYYESEDVFIERVEAVLDLGMTEIVLYYPFVASQEAMFEHLGTNVIPNLKAKHRSA